MKNTFLFLSLIWLLTSCSSFSKEECQSLESVGLRDGKAGRKARTSPELNEECGRHSVKVDEVRYANGLVEGRKIFCTQQSGFDFALSAQYYNGVCPKNLETDFLLGYERGKLEYQYRKREEEMAKQQQEIELQQAIFSQGQPCSFDSECGENRHCISEVVTSGSLSKTASFCR